jgi:hypothetical protein
MVDNDDPNSAWSAMQTQLFRHQPMEDMMAGKAGAMPIEDFLNITNEKLGVLKERYLEFLSNESIEDLTDDAMRRWSKYTDGLPLKNYENALDLVPNLVNLVSLADAIPVDGTSLPFDLRYIASKVKSAVFFAPRRFTACQFAFDEPRCRILLFHTGRMVGTGARALSNQHSPVHALGITDLERVVVLNRLQRAVCCQDGCRPNPSHHCYELRCENRNS